MADEEYELAVALRSEGGEQTQENIEQTGTALEDTTERAEESADEMESLSKRSTGALQAIVAGLSVVTAGLLSRIPVVSETLAGLGAVASAVGFQIDRTLRPALVPITNALFRLSDAIFAADGAAGTLIGTLGALGIAGTIAAAGLAGIGAIVPGLTAAGILGAAIGALKTAAGALFGLIAGSAAAAAAVGALIGVFGVAVLEMTGVLSAVRRLGRAVAQQLPASIRDGMLAVLGAFLGPLAIIGAAISGFVAGVLDGGLGEGIDRAVANATQALNIFAGAWRRTLSRVGTIISDLIGRAFGFGRSLIREFAAGIRSMASEVADAASDIAAEARAHLPGSPADRGPLSDLDETGPALAETFADGMAGGVGRVRSAAVDVAGAADDGGDGGDTVRVSTSAPDILLDGRKIERRTGRVGRDDTARRGI